MTRFSRFALSAAACAALLLPVAAAAQVAPAAPGQPPAAPPPIKNLQILPKDMPRPEVIAVMQTFTQGLGVGCAHCHVDDEPGRTNDFATDEKPAKNIARQMMTLTRDINTKLPAAVNKSAADATRVQCATCHRGVPIPKQIGEIVTTTAAAKGMPAAIDEYKQLRTKYYGSQSYDFSEGALVALAQRTIAANKPDEALPLLQLNLEFYPKSARTYLMMAQAYNRKNDKETAVKNVEKALELDPQNAQAKRMMDTLKK